MKKPGRTQWALLLGLLGAAWVLSMTLFVTGVWAYPWGWLVLMVLMGWTGYKMREDRE